MPSSKPRDGDSERPPREKRHRSSRSTRKSSSKDPLKSATTLTSPNTPTKRRTSMPGPEVEPRPSSASPGASKTSLPYPSFSKAHSKEAVGSTENVVNRLSYYTPDPTDLDRSKSQTEPNDPNAVTGNAPPSPPLTTMDQEKVAKVERKKSELQRNADELKRKLGFARSTSELKPTRQPSRSSATLRETKAKDDDRSTPRRSKTSTPVKLKPKVATVEDSSSATPSRRSISPARASFVADSATASTVDSDKTSIAPIQPSRTPGDRRASPSVESEPLPRSPTLPDPGFAPSRRETPAYSIFSNSNVVPMGDSPMPPPPPPPPDVPLRNPKVDYLMQNGGLTQSIPKSLLGVGQGETVQTTLPHSAQVGRFFGPFNTLLDDYTKVMARSGSMAVATGYRSIARRLLDRLEAVFARDIASETCTCAVCRMQEQPSHDGDEDGVSWGEILEYVSGRRELPQWPAFVLDSTQVGLGISSAESPCQKLDIDVPEEFRAHYISQSKKTKQSVDRWLESQPQDSISPPQDVDDETLTFAMLTRLEPHQRPLFSALAGIAQSRPGSTAPRPPSVSSAPSAVSDAPSKSVEAELLERTGLAIQRLYRLTTRPRDPESAIYLLTNPHLHSVLATLAAISDHEWDILTSGRFDGFLRSGAEDAPPQPPTISRGPTPSSRLPTPAVSTSTPAPPTAGAPVALDEETEISVLAEVEREIFLGMEALEDAFEALHLKAETVRRALRERGAGLSMANQARRGLACNLDARLGTPASVLGGEASEDDSGGGGGGWDAESEIGPDDSASNYSRRRTRRPRRREERRTPALVEEDEEGSVFGGGGRRR
ncbi:MAG: hypothetical protein HETSPECPRED_005848 [Heterodermia speciosa]|uniref:5-Methylcytosine G/T mismatch-specific DNA glycosylase n=1 Tax=Heterodermia speciosa TaxID=116794 RepID=A0A8H3ILN8_9LECA|nr:MAG: hypothetical protein HETSPECPRED_005848 [Heterodermia speciosa]